MWKTHTTYRTREFARIADKEDGSVVANHVPVALLSVEFYGKTARIASSVSTAFLTTDGGETDENRSLLANVAQELGLSEVWNVVRDLCVQFDEFGLIYISFQTILSSLPNTPWAPAPFAWTTRSGIRSLSKWAVYIYWSTLVKCMDLNFRKGRGSNWLTYRACQWDGNPG